MRLNDALKTRCLSRQRLKASVFLAILDFKVVLTRPLMHCGMVHNQDLVRRALSNLLVPRKQDWVQRGKRVHLFSYL